MVPFRSEMFRAAVQSTAAYLSSDAQERRLGLRAPRRRTARERARASG